MDLSPFDRSMLDLYMAACFHQWDKLPGGSGYHGTRSACTCSQVPSRLYLSFLMLPPVSLLPGCPADLARTFRARGASMAQLRGCMRHLVVFTGYGPCLAATLALQKAGLLTEDTPAKVAALPSPTAERLGRNDKHLTPAHLTHAGVRPPWRRI
jgi:hypothetical protein